MPRASSRLSRSWRTSESGQQHFGYGIAQEVAPSFLGCHAGRTLMVAGPVRGHRSGGWEPSLGGDSDRSVQRRNGGGGGLADSHRKDLGALDGEHFRFVRTNDRAARAGHFLVVDRRASNASQRHSPARSSLWERGRSVEVVCLGERTSEIEIVGTFEDQTLAGFMVADHTFLSHEITSPWRSPTWPMV